MELPFPFSLPLTSLTYEFLYLVTFVTHHFAMHYVVAGCLLILGASLWYRADEASLMANPVIRALRDWMPFGLSAAITFGVAPLLFVQLLFPKHFYTANLLLGLRWMVVIPALIAAFYLLYVLKSHWFERLRWWQRALVAGLNAGLFVFIGFCWTANYLVATQPEAWPETFASGILPIATLKVISRGAVWMSVAFVTMASLVVAQLAYLREGTATNDDLPTVSWLRWLALSGLGVFALAALGAIGFSTSGFAAITNGSGFLWVGLGIALWGGLIYSWISDASTTSKAWTLPRLGLVVGLLFCATVVRELVRVATIDYPALFAKHDAVGKVEGFYLFLITAVIVIGLIAVSVRWVYQSFDVDAPESET
ncbi:hypothetical protein [Blastopirellula marina]|uniref:Uncharacterized protein n=1 Tax=Blastopirellula marina TaxID=124 RepID=A0A2S8G192_9BACT|nr:hypothetical protein [Blastopirellula marina]PQO38206.1 hypothetical protein C5Y98_09045 [Blastopirellula marina]PTL44862.1 hypothetical protein C5Y97_09050 [Blastopirellula marina]